MVRHISRKLYNSNCVVWNHLHYSNCFFILSAVRRFSRHCGGLRLLFAPSGCNFLCFEPAAQMGRASDKLPKRDYSSEHFSPLCFRLCSEDPSLPPGKQNPVRSGVYGTALEMKFVYLLIRKIVEMSREYRVEDID